MKEKFGITKDEATENSWHFRGEKTGIARIILGATRDVSLVIAGEPNAFAVTLSVSAWGKNPAILGAAGYLAASALAAPAVPVGDKRRCSKIMVVSQDFYEFTQKGYEVTQMAIKSKELLDKKVVCEDLVVGEVKEVAIDPDQWKITHLEVELTKDAAEMVLGVGKGGIRNLLAVSAIGSMEKTIKLKVKKGQLKIYLRAPKLQ